MSLVTFHTPNGSATLSGSERAYAGGVITDMAIGLLNPHLNAEHLNALLPPGSYLASADLNDGVARAAWAARYATAAGAGFGDLVASGGRTWPMSTFFANTAMVLGSDPLRLFARIHWQCELHCWVDGPNRGWLAGIIAEGRKSRLYRPDAGWDQIIELLTATDQGEAVLSYSVGESFPEYCQADWNWLGGENSDPYEAFDALAPAEQWSAGMSWLRRQPGKLELRPDDWVDYRFGHKLTVLDILALDTP